MNNKDFLNPSVKTEHTVCLCSSPEHTIHFRYLPPSIEVDPTTSSYRVLDGSEFWFYVSLTWRPSFFKRCWAAIKYVFGYESQYGHFDCFGLDKTEALKLQKFLKEYIEEPT